MLFGPVLKELQAPQGIPTLDREHSHKAGNIHMGWGTTIHASMFDKAENFVRRQIKTTYFPETASVCGNLVISFLALPGTERIVPIQQSFGTSRYDDALAVCTST